MSEFTIQREALHFFSIDESLRALGMPSWLRGEEVFAIGLNATSAGGQGYTFQSYELMPDNDGDIDALLESMYAEGLTRLRQRIAADQEAARG